MGRIVLVAAAVLAIQSTSEAQSFDQISERKPAAGTTVYTINYPNVRQANTSYPSIVFQPGDRITITAAGCVQTGGRGKTWKRYLDPQGSNADEQYSAMIKIDGVTQGRQRLQLWVNQEHVATKTATLVLGYQDDNYGDNGYDGHDDGTGNQCRGIGAASVVIAVIKGPANVMLPGPRYNEVYQHSTHNAYENPKPSLRDQLEKFKIHSLEMDLHTGKGPGNPAPNGEWFVYHVYAVMQKTSCDKLSDCLAQLASWHKAVPRHEVVTIFLDLKDDWNGGHSAAELDAALKGAFGSALVTPATIAAPCTGTLRQAIARCKWPELITSRGKMIFVLTGGDSSLAAYVSAGGTAAFVAPEISSPDGIAAHPEAIFFNLNSDHFTVGGNVQAAGFVSRVYYYNTPAGVHGINDENNWKIAVRNNIHHIATDEIDAPWSRTRNAHGFPFTCMRHDCSSYKLDDTSGEASSGPRPPPPAPPPSSWLEWSGLGGGIVELSVAANLDGLLAVFAIGTDKALNYIAQTKPNGPWGKWESLGGGIRRVSSARNADGRLEVFAIGTDGALNHRAQTKPGGDWTPWEGLGGGIVEISVAANLDGRLEVFAIGTDTALNHIMQNKPGANWSGWQGLGGGIVRIDAVANADGRLEVFAIGTDKALNHIWQQKPGGDWTGWSGLGGGITELSALRRADGRIEVFAIGTDTALNHMWQQKPGGEWSGWNGLGGGIVAIATALNADGRAEVMAIGTDKALNHIYETGVGGAWSSWQGLGGGITKLGAARNRDGRIEVLAIGTDKALNSIAQRTPNAR